MNIANVVSATNLTQEATETAATTRQEASKGDPQAQRKLAQMQIAPPPGWAATGSKSGGHKLDVHG